MRRGGGLRPALPHGGRGAGLGPGSPIPRRRRRRPPGLTSSPDMAAAGSGRRRRRKRRGEAGSEERRGSGTRPALACDRRARLLHQRSPPPQRRACAPRRGAGREPPGCCCACAAGTAPPPSLPPPVPALRHSLGGLGVLGPPRLQPLPFPRRLHAPLRSPSVSSSDPSGRQSHAAVLRQSLQPNLCHRGFTFQYLQAIYISGAP